MLFNMAWYFLDSNLDAGRGDKIAVRWNGGAWSYRDVIRDSDKLGNVLRDLGVAAGDRVLIVLPDIPEFVASFFATLRIGAIVTIANPLLTSDELTDLCAYTEAKVVITFPEVSDRLASVRDRCIPLVVGRDYEARMAKASPSLVWAETTENDVACWLFSGGTTGRPKAVVHRHRDFAFSHEHYARQVLGITERDVTLAVPKLFFAYATGTNLLFPLAAGATTCLFSERSTADAVFENIRRFRPTILTNVPTMVDRMIRHPAQDLSSLRVTLTAGEALPPDLYSRWKERFGVELLDGIGSVEMFHIYISQRVGEVRPGSLGRVVPGYETEIRGEDGATLKNGEVGRLWARGGSAGTGYFGLPEPSKETFHGEWVKTADLFRKDDEGYHWYCGRADDLLKVGGVFVAPIEVEGCLLRHTAVAEAAACGYTDEHGLVKPGALVVPKTGVKPDAALVADLQEFVKRSIAPYKYPRRVRFVPDLPRTDRGKVDRKRLPELLR